MKKVTITSILLISLFATACGGDQESSDANGENNAEASANQVNVPDDPCDIINADDVRTLLSVGAEYEISMESKNYTFPTCTFRWEDEKVVKKMNVGGREMEIQSPSQVMIVLVKDANAEKFQRSVKVYKDGEKVDGIGNEAMWGAEMNQLSFRKGSVMMHVNVKADNDSSVNKKKALKIAEFLLGEI